MTPVVNYIACGYCCDLMLRKKIVFKLEKFIQNVRIDNKSITIFHARLLKHYIKLSIVVF